VLERLLGLDAPEARHDVAREDARHLGDADVSHEIGQAERVVEEAAVVVDAREPPHADEIRAHHLAPERVDCRDLRQEPMSADVEAKAAVHLGARESAD
jgi:hypothetical protein